MATHGLFIGGFVGVGAFCLIYRQPYRVIFDALAIPTAMILAVGRIGNFIDGQIVGSVTSVPWGVELPRGRRLPPPGGALRRPEEPADRPGAVVVRRRGAPAGREAAVFLFLYAFLRIFIDLRPRVSADADRTAGRAGLQRILHV